MTTCEYGGDCVGTSTMCDACRNRIEVPMTKLEFAERMLISMDEAGCSAKDLRMHEGYIRALQAGYQHSAWDFANGKRGRELAAALKREAGTVKPR